MAQDDVGPSDGEQAPGKPDLGAVMAEIDAEVRRRRLSGDISPRAEAELQEEFDRYAPMSVKEDSLKASLRALGAATLVNPDVPVDSRIPGGRFAKRVLRKAMGWYVNYVTQQTRSLGITTLGAVHSVIGRLNLLEERLQAIVSDDPVEVGRVSVGVADSLVGLGPQIASELEGIRGRVLHAECGDGWLLAKLAEAGLDAYGVDPRAEVVAPLMDQGLDAWDESVYPHLRSVGEATLSAVVLTGLIDRVPLERKRQVLASAAAAVRPGGKVAIASVGPAGWEVAPVVERDLAPGGPLHHETWSVLMEASGLESTKVIHGEAGSFVVIGVAAA